MVGQLSVSRKKMRSIDVIHVLQTSELMQVDLYFYVTDKK